MGRDFSLFANTTFRHRNYNPVRFKIDFTGDGVGEKQELPHTKHRYKCLICDCSGTFVTKPDEVPIWHERSLCWDCWRGNGRQYWHWGVKISAIYLQSKADDHMVMSTFHRVLLTFQQEIKNHAKQH